MDSKAYGAGKNLKLRIDGFTCRTVRANLSQREAAFPGEATIAAVTHLPSSTTAAEQPCFSTHSPRTHQIFEMVVVYGYVAVAQVGRQRGLVIQAVVKRLGRSASVGNTVAFQRQPGEQRLPQRFCSGLSLGQSLLSG